MLKWYGIKEGDEWGYFVLPNKKASLPPSVIFEAGPIMVAKNAKDKDAALDAIDFWMAEAASAKWTELMFFRLQSSSTSFKKLSKSWIPLTISFILKVEPLKLLLFVSYIVVVGPGPLPRPQGPKGPIGAHRVPI